MNSLPRLVGYSILLLLAFLGAGFGAQAWLQRQSEQVRAAAIQDKRDQFEAALAGLTPPVDLADETRRQNLERMLGARILLLPRRDNGPTFPADAPGQQTLGFEYDLEPGIMDGRIARLTFPMPAAGRLILVNQRMVFVLVLVVPAALTLLAGAFLLGSMPGAGTRAPWSPSAKAEMGSLEHLARTSVAQGEALNRERDERRRAEENALLNQQLLNQSLEEKIRLGRDLHDGIIQSLYAVGLTLESVRTLAATDPGEADRRLGQCLEHLNASIREVRAYISGLAPENLRHSGFAQALRSLVEELRAERDVQFDLRIDEDATGLLSSAQSADVLQIAREAISNGLRHGRATHVVVRLHRSDQEVCLLVQDDGAGFDPARRSTGHGLGNMQARAAALGATVRVESRPGSGARVLLTLPALQPA